MKVFPLAIQILIAIIVLLVLWTVRPAHAEPLIESMTASKMRTFCGYTIHDPANLTPPQLMYMSYCYGTINGLRYSQTYLFRDDEKLFCVPGQTSNQEAAYEIVKYITRHPDLSDRGAVLVSIDALREAYPCGNNI